MNHDWELLGKMLIAANQIGIRIEQDSGHRWIIEDQEADFSRKLFSDSLYKEYSSYQSALWHIDKLLKEATGSGLLDIFKGINHFDDLALVFEPGTQ